MWRWPVLVVCFAPLGAACSAGSGSLPASGVAAPAAVAGAKLPPVVYASNFLNGTIYAYRISGSDKQPVQVIRGLESSIGFFVDRARHLYVSQQGKVLEFSTSGQQIRTYDDSAHDPLGVAKCPNGTLYAANAEFNTISVYAHGSTTPTSTIVDYGAQVFHLACDRKNDVFVTVGGKSGQVDEFPAGSTQPVNLPISLFFPEGIQADDAGDVVVANSASIDFYHVGDSQPFKSIAVPGGALELAFERGDAQVWETNGTNLLRYAVATGKLTKTISGSYFGGLATSPSD